MNSKSTSPGLSPLAILFVALALSIGWGVRGNWGHEYGAMIPGALAAMAAVLVSGRDDWLRRIPFFAFFGALGWSFGGSIAYMILISYTHSGHLPSVLYGFAALFLVGFIWGGLGGAGTALPAYLSRARLTELMLPVTAVLVAWFGQTIYFRILFAGLREQVEKGIITKQAAAEQVAWLDWYDTDWIAVLVAACAVLVLAVVRRRICWGTQLVLYMCAGWWLGFTLLTVGLNLHLIAPWENKSDNWSGALGMTIGVIAFFIRRREWEILWATIVTGFFGGLGFSGATLIKLVLVHEGFQKKVFGGPISSNWHSILEQSFGFIAGIGVALALGYLSTRSPRHTEEAGLRRWAEPLCVLFVMLVITYINIVKNLEAVWLKNRTIEDTLWGLSSTTWFNLAYLALAVTIAVPLVAYYRGRELAVLPASRLGKGQLFFIVFLWWIVIGNLSRTVPFPEQRLITEGVIHVNACLCTLFALLLPASTLIAGFEPQPNWRQFVRNTALSAAIGAALVVAGEFGLVRGLYGDTFAGHAGKHVRFGPDATTQQKEK